MFRLVTLRQPAVIVTLAVAAALFTSATARASFTPVNPPYPGEDTLEQVFEHVYGGDFTLVGAVDYTNGTVDAERQGDDLDQLIPAGLFDIVPLASFALYSQHLDYVPGSSGSALHEVTYITGKAYAVSGAVTGVEIDDLFRWARHGNGGGVVTSQETDNADGYDHLLTFRVTGLPDQGSNEVFVLFFEDNLLNLDADFDYNDLVVQVTRINPTIDPNTPEPAAIGLLTVGLAALALRRRA